MSEEIKKVAFDAGFEQEKNGDTANLTYKDQNVFVDNSPIKASEIKKFKQYGKSFSEDFLAKSVEVATEQFKKDKDLNVINTKVAFGGTNKGDVLSVNIQKSVKMMIQDLQNGGPAKEIETSVIRMNVKDTNTVSKSAIKAKKEELNSIFNS